MSQYDPQTTADLTERLLRAAVGGCTCLTKSPDIQWHDTLCHYRLFTESFGEIEMWRMRDAQSKQIVAALETMKEIHRGS
jgi:hypothetical protein